jgi:ATP-binding cassette subfamily B multidrug efflux pump
VHVAPCSASSKPPPPLPAAEPALPPNGFVAFLWACTSGLRGKIALAGAAHGRVSAFEALLFAMLGRIVDWLGGQVPARLWADRGTTLSWLAIVLVASIGVVAMQTIVKHQTLAINFPMRLRWNFHRLMLGQSMAFYQDEFAGRVTAKVMQTALAVRETMFVLADVLVAWACTSSPDRCWPAARHAADDALRDLAAAVHRCARGTSCRAWAASARRRPTRAP